MNIATIVEASFPLVGGVAGIWLGYVRAARPGGGETEPKPPLVRRLRWIWPLLFAWGVVQLANGLTAEPARVDAGAVAKAMRTRYSPPAMLDEVTRLDEVRAVGRHVVFSATVTTPPAAEPERERLLAEMGRRIKMQFCGEKASRNLLNQDLGFQFEYTMAGKQYPAIVIVRADCGTL